ncbi:hypothetical protein IEN85_15800 [Pelagicoccus sp. NFK12]|uniref:Uncharacterized protein n=1 Tax=Pelagicoccus enzymogenes TaxID=2773457 RepID=A0A927FAQ3_9BACT|nr:hypothetical protein [Pelagicoccus enzymogenes]
MLEPGIPHEAPLKCEKNSQPVVPAAYKLIAKNTGSPHDIAQKLEEEM